MAAPFQFWTRVLPAQYFNVRFVVRITSLVIRQSIQTAQIVGLRSFDANFPSIDMFLIKNHARHEA
jgi:hypothetical protein